MVDTLFFGFFFSCTLGFLVSPPRWMPHQLTRWLILSHIGTFMIVCSKWESNRESTHKHLCLKQSLFVCILWALLECDTHTNTNSNTVYHSRYVDRIQAPFDTSTCLVQAYAFTYNSHLFLWHSPRNSISQSTITYSKWAGINEHTCQHVLNKWSRGVSYNPSVMRSHDSFEPHDRPMTYCCERI